MANSPAVDRKVALFAEQAPLGVPTMWACRSIRMEVAFAPERTEDVIP